MSRGHTKFRNTRPDRSRVLGKVNAVMRSELTGVVAGPEERLMMLEAERELEVEDRGQRKEG